jgi:hypothetical protein
MNDELEGMCQEMAVTYLKVFYPASTQIELLEIAKYFRMSFVPNQFEPGISRMCQKHCRLSYVSW